MRNNGTLKFTLYHMNYIFVETWFYFKLSYTMITQEDFNNTHLLPLYTPDKGTKHQAWIVATQMSKVWKYDDIE